MRIRLQLIALLFLPVPLAAQGARVSFPPPPNANQSVLLSLRSLARAEEQYLERRMRYAGSVDSLRFTPESGVTVVVTWASQRGWSAKGMWDKSPGRSCVVYFGYSHRREAAHHGVRGTPAQAGGRAGVRPDVG